MRSKVKIKSKFVQIKLDNATHKGLADMATSQSRSIKGQALHIITNAVHERAVINKDLAPFKP